MISRLTAEFFRMRSVVLNLRRAGKRTHHAFNIGRLEAQAEKNSPASFVNRYRWRAPRVCAALRAAAINAAPIPRPRTDSSTYSERISAASIFDSTPITPTGSSPTYATM